MTDTGYATDRWSFDEEVTRVFDDMLNRSIPAYQDMRHLTTRLAEAFIKPGRDVLDLGTSRGDAIALLDPAARPATQFVGVEISEPMRSAAQSRFVGVENVSIVDVDLRDRSATQAALGSNATVALSVLALQFVPIEHRAQIIDDIYAALVPGGALLLVEKVLGSSGRSAALLAEIYHEGKRRAGYSSEDVERKRLALEGVLVAQTASANEEMLRAGGFSIIECYWRWANFAAWIAIA